MKYSILEKPEVKQDVNNKVTPRAALMASPKLLL
jgi:hypothetical protein